jgi:hypothetical protein
LQSHFHIHKMKKASHSFMQFPIVKPLQHHSHFFKKRLHPKQAIHINMWPNTG